MKTFLILTASFLILSGALALGQQPAANNNPNNSIFSSDLVMWSYMQEAQPEPGQTRQTPDPSPETQPQQNPTAPQQYPPDSPAQGSQTSDKSQTRLPRVSPGQ